MANGEIDLLEEVMCSRYDRWRYAHFQLVSIGPLPVDVLCHTSFLILSFCADGIVQFQLDPARQYTCSNYLGMLVRLLEVQV